MRRSLPGVIFAAGHYDQSGQVIGKINGSGIPSKLWINGSFLTEKLNPDVVDISMNITAQVDLQDTDLTLERLKALARQDPNDEITHVNSESIEKRRKDLERKLNYELTAQQADIIEYKIERVEINSYPATAIAASILSFQELLTSVFDAIRSTPKKRYHPSADSVELSSMDFAGARAGSVVVSLSVQNERLLAVKSQLDDTFGLVFSVLHARTDANLRDRHLSS